MTGDTFIPLSNLNIEDKQLIEVQLQRIVESKFFKSAKQPRSFLEYVVTKAIEGKERFIKQYTIGVEALLLPDDFDPDKNPGVRIMGGRVRDRLKQYYDTDGCSDEIVFSIPKGTYVPEFKKIINEKYNSGLDQDISRGPKIALASFSDATQNKTCNRLLFQITDVLALEISHFPLIQAVVFNPYSDKSQSHAVSSDLKKGKADYVLALYLQKLSSSEYLLTYRLVYTNSGDVLWSESYTITKLPINEQDHIVAKIMSKAADNMEGIIPNHWSRRLLENQESIPKCHKVIAYYRYYFDSFDRGAFVKSVKICREALNRNPNDVVAILVYASYCKFEYVYGYGVIESPLKVGRKYAEKAIRLRPTSNLAHFFLAQMLCCQKKWKQSLEEFKITRSITTSNTPIEYGIGFNLCMMNMWEEGLPLVKKAMSLSAYNPLFHLVPFLDFYRQEKYKEALYEAKKIIVPGLVHGPLTRCVAYAQLGEFEKANIEFQEIIKRYPQFMETGKSYMGRFLVSEILTEKIWDGIILVRKNSN